MLKRHKNQLLQTIRDAGFSPEKFEAEEATIGENEGFVITYRGSDLRFFVRTSSDSYHLFDSSFTKLAPKFPRSPWFPSINFATIETISAQLAEWLSKHLSIYVEELSTPDHWLEATAQAKFIGQDFPKNKADTFSEEEKEQIRVSLANVRLLIQEEFKPTATQQAIVEERLTYLAKAVDRLSKFDWRGVMLSTIIGISTNLSLDTSRGAQLLQLFKKAFSGVVHLLQ